MPQLNIYLTPELEEALTEYMRLRRVKTKSDAIRLAMREALDREHRLRTMTDFSLWLGMAKQVLENPDPRFRSDDDLWLKRT